MTCGKMFDLLGDKNLMQWNFKGISRYSLSRYLETVRIYFISTQGVVNSVFPKPFVNSNVISFQDPVKVK